MKNIIAISIVIFLVMNFQMNAKPYKGGELRTLTPFVYGKFEVRMKSAAGSGLLSSFFTFNDGPNLPANWNEIDIEIMGRYTNEVQFNVISQGQINHDHRQIVQYNPHESFHVYAIEWTPDYVAWFVDGYEIYRQTGDHIVNLFFSQKLMMNIWPPDYPSWVGNFDPSILPVYAYYDWVKYYSYTPGTEDNFTLQWVDDFSNWNQSRWGKGTHTWFGNNCDFVTQNAIFQNGYFVLCLTNDSNLGYSGATIVDDDIEAPYLVWARSYFTYMDVFFSERLDTINAQTISNYTIPGITINAATLLSDQRTVRLYVDSLNASINYNLIVTGIKDQAQPANTMGLSFIVANNPLEFPININIAGDAQLGFLEGQEWEYDYEYGRVGGNIINHPQGTNFQGTTEPEIYQSELRDITFYNIRIPDGTYNVTLMMAETEHSASNQRIFDIYAEGQLYFDDVDIFSEVGSFTANEKIINGLQVTDVMLLIYLESSIGETVLSGIKIEKIITSIEYQSNLPKEFNWNISPNPFNSTVSINYELNKPAITDLNLYNLKGQFIKKIFRQHQNPGSYKFHYSADGLSTGMYFIEIIVDGLQKGVQKAIYLK
jgi:hypothetical protein